MNQKEALDILKLGHNVYLTGSAGSGKTFLLNQYIKHLQDKGAAVGITASTGIAATHLKGITIHSWSGLGIKDRLSAEDLRHLKKKRYLANRLIQAKVLIIDEISMLPDFYLDLVDEVCRVFKQSSSPFGGLQVVLCGDFFQLPPVNRNGQNPKFAFWAKAWSNLNLKICYLDEQHRHQDSRLVEILNQIRANNLGGEALACLNARRDKDVPGFSKITKLYTHNLDVDAINSRQLMALPGRLCGYQMRSSGRPPLVAGLKNSCLAPAELFLKKEALVMFVKNNFEQGYVNGTLGKVIDFDPNGLPIVETMAKRKIVAAPVAWVIEEDEAVIAEIVQIPLRLAWAITVHKSQGMSLDGAEIDLSKSFERGMGYVALSRVRSLEGLRLMGLNEMALLVNEEVSALDQKLKEMSQAAAGELGELEEPEKIKRQEYFLQSIVPAGRPKPRPKKIPGATYEETKNLLSKNLSIREMANRRGLTEGTIVSHLEKLAKRGEELNLDHLKLPEERFAQIKAAFIKSDGVSLSPVREILGDSFSYDELRLARLFLAGD